MGIDRLPRSVTRALGYYIYLYVDPETREVFYVGKGKGGRAFSHLNPKVSSPLGKAIRALKQRGLNPR